MTELKELPFIIRHINLKQDASIPKHNHPEEIIYFHLEQGKVEITIGDGSKVIGSGAVIKFDGNQFISARALENSVITVYGKLKNEF